MAGTITDRHQRILQEMDRRGACTYQDLSELLGVSTMTIRRDIDRLAAAGEVIKALGGAQKAHAPRDLYESPVMSRLSENRPLKQAIVRAAMDMIAPGQTVFLDGSSTCLELAKLLASQGKAVTVVANSALVCMALGVSSQIVVLGIGGQLDSESLCFVGPASEEWASTFFVDIAFVSTKAFVPAEGTFESSLANFRVKRIVAEHAGKLALLVDHTKFGRRALCKVFEPSQIDIVITDSQVGPDDLSELHRGGGQLVLAPAQGQESASCR